jgi:multiple sugar transport system ATP-binding protein
MRAELSDLHLRLNATMIYVTHDQVEAMTMANKIVVMKDGLIQQIGEPLELYNHPVNKFVAGFIGSPPMNFLSVRVREEGSSIILDEGSFKIKADPSHFNYLTGNYTLPNGEKGVSYIGKEVFFGIRPEDMTYTEKDSDNSMTVKITVVEPLGADIHLWLTTETQPLVARTEPNHTFKVGDTAIFVPRMEKARYFDKEKETAIIPSPDA